MHDIDRIRLETQSETGMFEAGPFEANNSSSLRQKHLTARPVKCSARPSRWSSRASCSKSRTRLNSIAFWETSSAAQAKRSESSSNHPKDRRSAAS